MVTMTNDDDDEIHILRMRENVFCIKIKGRDGLLVGLKNTRNEIETHQEWDIGHVATELKIEVERDAAVRLHQTLF